MLKSHRCLSGLVGVLLLVPTAGSAQVVARVSVGSDGTQANAPSRLPSISADGRFVAFISRASNFAGSGCASGALHIFVHDRLLGTTVCVSASAPGTAGSAGASPFSSTSLSADGRFVAFTSGGPVGACTGGSPIAVHDRVTRQSECVSVASDGTPGDNTSNVGILSGDGRFVVFHSFASNLVPGCAATGPDGSPLFQAYLHDRHTRATACLSRASDGTPGQGGSVRPMVSGNGRFVVFESTAGLAPPCSAGGVFVYDRVDGSLTCASVTGAGAALPSTGASISADGRFVVFTAGGFPEAGCNDLTLHLRLRDREAGTTVCLPDPPGYRFPTSPSISGDGRFVSFWAFNSATPELTDVFVHDRMTGVTSRVSVAPDGTPGNGRSFTAAGLSGAAAAGDARLIVFQSLATNFVAGDTNGMPDGVCDVQLGERCGDDIFVARVASGPNWILTGASGQVRGYDALLERTLLSRDAYEAEFQGGVRVALGDVTGDGTPEIVVAPGPGRAAAVRVLTDPTAGTPIAEFLAYEADFAGGVYVAACDIDGSGRAAIITGPGPGLAPEVRIFRLTGDPVQPVVRVASFLAYEASFAGGVRVGCRSLVQGVAHLVTAPGPGRAPLVRVFVSRAAGATLPTRPVSTRTEETADQVRITAPADGTGFEVLDRTPLTFTWTPLPGAAQYGFEFTGPDRRFANPHGSEPDPVNGFGGAGGGLLVTDPTLTVVLDSSIPGGSYEVRVIGVSAAGEPIGRFSDAITVRIGRPDLPSLVTSLADYLPFEPTWTGGVSVAIGVLDGQATVVAGRGPGGLPDVHLVSALLDPEGRPAGPVLERRFLAYGGTFDGGVNVAIGDTDGAGRQQVITAPTTQPALEGLPAAELPVRIFASPPVVGAVTQLLRELATGAGGPSGGLRTLGGVVATGF